MNNTNNQSARMSFDIAKRTLFNAWYPNWLNVSSTAAEAEQKCWDWVNGRKLSQSEIRLEVELNNANNIFTFGLTPQQQNSTSTVFNTEQRLTLQDSLIASEYGIYVAKPASRTDTLFQLRTYPNPIDFTAAAAAALDGTFYANGNFQIRVNNDVIIPYRGLFNHLYRGQTQQTAALGAGSPDDQIRGAEDGQITEEPNIYLIGSKNYVPQIVLPANLATVDAFTRVVLIFRGVLAQNSTSIN